jgi:putative RNA 2'-phosphotransferase
VDLGLEATTPPDLLFHGTPKSRVDSIRASGIDRGSRHHVHLSPDMPTARRVGARRGEAVVLSIDAGTMAQEGHEFFVTANGVWLTDFVPARFIHFPA